jgi:glycosyltransferase involved in cell wall biosynthesis
VLASGDFGGLESVVRALAGGLLRRGHEVRVAAVLDLEPTPHPFESAMAREGIPVEPIRLPARAYRRERRELAALCRRLRPQVVHSHGYRADVQAGAVAHRLGIPAVTTVHGFTGGDWKNRLYQWLQERALRRCQAVVAVSEPLARHLAAGGVPDECLHLVRNAWSRPVPLLARDAARSALDLPGDAFVVGWVGRVSREKGPDLLIEAMAKLGDLGIQACMVGDGPQRRALEGRASRLGLGDRVHWAGSRDDAAGLYAAFDAFALSSRTEGTPIALFEAMDARVPIVATRVGGVLDVVGPEEALLVEPEGPGALAGALRDLHASPAAATRRSEAAARRLAADFRPEPWLERYEEIYGRLDGRAPGSAAHPVA